MFFKRIRSINYFKQGFLKLEAGYLRASLADFSKAIKLDFKNENAFKCRGDEKFNMEDYKGAIEDYSEVIKLNPNNKNAFKCRGDSKYYLKDYEDAIEDFSKAI